MLWEERNSIDHNMNSMNSIDNIECVLIGSTQIKNEQKQGSDTIKISGIYKIINKINGKYYVGSSDNIFRRLKNHLYELRGNRHANNKLQNAWNKYGECSFRFQILEMDDFINEEQKELNVCKIHREQTYNLCFDAIAPMSGRCHTIQTRIKMGISQKGHPVSKTTREKLRRSRIGKYSGKNSPTYGRMPTLEQRNKISEKNRDTTIYTFLNTETNESFTGTRYDFGIKYSIDKHNIFNLVKRRTSRYKSWILS